MWYNNENKISKENTKVVYGEEKTIEVILKVLDNTNVRWDNCSNSQGPVFMMESEQIKKELKNAFARGVKIRCISEIVKHNINFCKELMKIAELRHLDCTKGWNAVNETEYVSTAHLQVAKTVSCLIYSDIQEIIEQQQLIFEGFWSRAITAEKRISEIEEGYDDIETNILDNKEKIYIKLESLAETSDELLVCSDIGRLQMTHKSLFKIYQKIMDKYDKGYHEGIRWITSIQSKEDVDIVKLFMDMGIKIRHIRNLPIINYLINNQNFLSNIYETDATREKELPRYMLTSNDPSYINHYKTIFENFWKSGIDAIDVIEDIERGFDPESIDIVSKSNNLKNLYIDLIRSAKKEIMLIFPTSNAFLRQHKIGVTAALLESATDNNIPVRVLMPKSEFAIQSIDLLKKEESRVTNIDNFEVRYIDQLSDTKATILIIDKKVSLVMELKDDTKDTFCDAIGLSTYSNSKAGVLSYVSVFVNLWKQVELYQELEKTNEQLKNNETLQKDFIRIAAHELRTPVQPIIGLSGILMSKLEKEKELYKIAKIINRNAKKLIKLTKDILDIAKIETNSLTLNKELVNLRLLLIDNINEYKNVLMTNTDLQSNYTFSNKKGKYPINAANLMFCETYRKEKNKNDVFLLAEGDRSLLSQVIYNLLDNACKFTGENDTISITLEKESTRDESFAIVNIKDTGKGIDPEIMPRLFTKFATKSFHGTGLGLYICKNIIEAHGGKIWAKNNEDGKGATFSFWIPLYKEGQ
ncbi:MAG: sensor histidine kinase [Candidatus Nitrosocosmicus sp.]